MTDPAFFTTSKRSERCLHCDHLTIEFHDIVLDMSTGNLVYHYTCQYCRILTKVEIQGIS